MNSFVIAAPLLLYVFALSAAAVSAATHASVVVYGATGGGVISAIAAARTLQRAFPAVNSKVILLSANKHVGGMVTGGLQHSDSANGSVIGGIALEYFTRVEEQYPGRNTSSYYPHDRSGPQGWLAESHVKEKVMNEMLLEANVSVVRDVIGIESVSRKSAGDSTVVTGIQTAAGHFLTADVFIDGSYEGDLAYYAGAEMTWGRESAAQYGEVNAGRTRGEKPDGLEINPYWDSASKAVIPHVFAGEPVAVGEADKWIENYDFRLCFTNSPGHRIPIEKPPSYNASEWEFWRRIYKQKPPRSLQNAGLSCIGPVPNNYNDCGASGRSSCRKCDMLGMNHGTDFINGAWNYPNGTIEERKKIWRAHIEFTRGLLWFWASDDAVPKRVRDELKALGHCSDEYDSDSDPPHWPHQLYVREGRRLVGDFVWTQHSPPANILRRSVGLGSYSFDSHIVSRVILGGAVLHEGRVHAFEELRGVEMPPFEMPFDVLLPQRNKVSNLLVPVAVSSTHVRFNAIRMEPTWMILGHAAGVAAAIAVAHHEGNVQAVDITELQKLLVEQKQKIRL